MPIELTVDQQRLNQAAKALRTAEDGKALRKELIADLRSTADHAVSDLKSSAMAIPSKGHAGQALRPAIAASIKPAVRLSGRNTGVAIRQSGTAKVRAFKYAGRKFNRAAAWRHPVFGGAWVAQSSGRPQWFDDTAKSAADPARRAAMEAIDRWSRRIASQAGGS